MSDEPRDLDPELENAIRGDPDVAVTRAANTTIRRSGQLTVEEKLLLGDLLAQFMSSREHMAHEFVHHVTQLYDQFLRAIFKNWSSNTRRNPPPTWIEPKFSETSVQVGVLAVNHPEPGSGGVIPRLPVSPARSASAPAILGVALNLEEDSFSFIWRDENGRFINPKYVRLDDEFNMARAKAHAIEHYDHYQRERITSYNIRLVVSAARRSIRKWALRGSQPEVEPDNEDIVAVDQVRELVLASDFLQGCRDVLAETIAELSQRDPAVTSFGE
ncbi:hypothetical protein N0V84_010409 [Fusarium piperis]|uniref:Uncharacterized protein n=1 Tax=Fusarium piperis TaxID=1435070 RepID=A0A9W8TD39_9HYPO|nr:hypothetical protein N0V84_010409 [Fusarium piperis]